jgi:Luciferase
MVPNAEIKIASEVRKWSGVTSVPHRFGGIEFRIGRREIGHLHGDYQADIAFPMNVRNQLVAEKKAQPHHILPKSGWITFRFNEESDVSAAIELFRLSYDIAREKASVELENASE